MTLKSLAAMIVVAVLAIVGVALRPTSLGGPMHAIVVSGESMEPAYRTGDLVITRAQPDYEVGDIVAYRVDGGGQVIHRIIGRDGDRFLTQGDNRARPDEWTPTAEQIIGAGWVQLPGAGNLLASLRSPVPFALTVLAGAFLLPWPRRRTDEPGDPEMTSAHRRRRPTAPPTLLPLAVAGIAVVALLAAAWAWSTPAERTTRELAGVGTERATLRYEAAAMPSALYPNGRVGPVDAADTDTDREPLYPALTEDAEFTITWEVAGLSDVAGSWTPVVELVGGDGWRRPISVEPATPFEGSTLEAELDVSISEIVATLSRIAEETGTAPVATVEIGARIDAAGFVGGEPVELGIDPTVGFAVSTDVLVPGDVSGTEGVVEGPVVANESRSVGSFDVAQLRWLLPAVALLAGVAASLGLWELRRVSRRHDAPLRRHGIEVVEVATEPAVDVLVASAEDLARLVRPGVDVVVHHRADGRHTYVVDRSGTAHGWRVVDASAQVATAARPGDAAGDELDTELDLRIGSIDPHGTAAESDERVGVGEGARSERTPSMFDR